MLSAFHGELCLTQFLVSAAAAQWDKKKENNKNNNSNKSSNSTDKSNNSTDASSRMLKSHQYFEVTSRAGHFKHAST